MIADRIVVTTKEQRPWRVQVFGEQGEYLCDLPVTSVSTTKPRAVDSLPKASLEFHGFRVEVVEDDS